MNFVIEFTFAKIESILLNCLPQCSVGVLLMPQVASSSDKTHNFIEISLKIDNFYELQVSAIVSYDFDFDSKNFAICNCLLGCAHSLSSFKDKKFETL